MTINSQSISPKKIRLIMHLRSMGITDSNTLAALEKVPRETFVPQAMLDQAYEDIALPIGLGQTISQPYVVAAMTQALGLDHTHTVLEIGTGSGYQACILAQLARRVYTIERHKPLMALAEEKFETLKLRNITAVCADGMRGWPQKINNEPAQFDKIIITAAAVSKPPTALLDQLKIGGVMVIPVGQKGQDGQTLRRYVKESEEAYAMKDLMPVRFVPLLPEVAESTMSQLKESA